jgi:hypothetical protein
LNFDLKTTAHTPQLAAIGVPSDFINLAQRFAQPQQNSSTSMNGNALQPQPFNPEVIVTPKKTEETES